MKIITDIASAFSFKGTLVNSEPYGNGHINDTFALTYDDGSRVKRYILQRMNKSVFPDIDVLMENVAAVTEFLREKIDGRGGGRAPDRHIPFRPPGGDTVV